MDIRDILTQILMARAAAPETGAGFGRSGYIPAGPRRPIRGLATKLAGPVMQRDFGGGPQVTAPEIPPGSPEPVAAPPSVSPAAQAAVASALLGRQAMPGGGSGGVPPGVPFNPPPLDPGTALAPEDSGVQVQPFRPEPLDPGTPLAPEDNIHYTPGQYARPATALGGTVRQQLSQQALMELPQAGQRIAGEPMPVDLGMLPPVTIGGTVHTGAYGQPSGFTLDPNLGGEDAATQEIARRMIEQAMLEYSRNRQDEILSPYLRGQK